MVDPLLSLLDHNVKVLTKKKKRRSRRRRRKKKKKLIKAVALVTYGYGSKLREVASPPHELVQPQLGNLHQVRVQALLALLDPLGDHVERDLLVREQGLQVHDVGEQLGDTAAARHPLGARVVQDRHQLALAHLHLHAAADGVRGAVLHSAARNRGVLADLLGDRRRPRSAVRGTPVIRAPTPSRSVLPNSCHNRGERQRKIYNENNKILDITKLKNSN